LKNNKDKRKESLPIEKLRKGKEKEFTRYRFERMILLSADFIYKLEIFFLSCKFDL
jgi:hypothetical protein